MDVDKLYSLDIREIYTSLPERIIANTFVGREKELRDIQDLWIKTLKGCGRFLAVFGEGGMGKKTLVDYFARSLKDSKCCVVSVSLKNTPSYEPYLPIQKLLNSLERRVLPVQASSDLGQGLVNQSVEKSGDFSAVSLYSLQADQRLVQQRLVSRILEASRQGPLFLALFDADHAPLTTWQFIHYLSESITDNPIMLIVTVPEEDSLTRSSKVNAYMDVIQRMNRERLVQKIHLQPFTEKDIRKFLFQILQKTDFSSYFIEHLEKVSRGIPDKLARLVELMIENGLICREGEVWFDRENLTREELLHLLDAEESIGNAAALLNQLTEPQQVLLKYAALFQEKFNHIILSAVVNRPRIRVAKDLTLLQQARILQQTDESEYQFRHPGIRHSLLEQMGAEKQRQLHLEIAWAIEADYPDRDAEKIYLLAYHYYYSGEKKGAFRYLHLAGKQALKNFAFLESHRFYQKILTFLAEVIAEKPSTECVHVLQEAAWVTRVLGNRQESLAYFEQALDLCDRLKDDSLKMQLQVQIGLTHFQLNEWDAARGYFEACLKNADHAPLTSVAMSHYGLGNVFFELADYAKARENYEKALKLTRQLDMKIITANILNNLGAVENVRGNRLRAIMLYSQSIPVYQGLGDDLGLARVYNNIGISYADEGDWHKANEFYGKSLSVSDDRGLIPVKTLTFLNRTYTLIHLKAFEAAREYNFKAYRHLRKLNDELGLAEYYKNQGIIEREEGNLAVAAQHFADALKKYRKLQHKLGLSETEYEYGILAARATNRTEALSHFQNAADIFRELGLQKRVQEVEEQIRLLT